MKKQIFSVLLVISMIASLNVTSAATTSTPVVSDGPVLQSSALLIDTILSANAKSNHAVEIGVNVRAKTAMDKVGVLVLQIQKNVNGTWYDQETAYSSDHPEFLAYNAYTYSGSYTFYGSPGVTYRAVATIIARKGDQMETRTYTSLSVVCN